MPGTKAYRARGAWQQAIKAAEAANEPGRFTAFIGYEWTSNMVETCTATWCSRWTTSKVLQVEPYITMKPLAATTPRSSGKWMAADEAKNGRRRAGDRPQPTSSNGRMFPVVKAFGRAIDRSYAEERAKWERLDETTQTKGTGEAHPFLSPNDEFADYEIWDKGNLDVTVAKTKDMLQFEYTRQAFKNGLLLEQALGSTLYKFGLLREAANAHTGLTAMEEDNFFGKIAPAEPSPEALTRAFMADPWGHHGWKGRRFRLRGGLGHREHPRGPLRRHAAPRDVRDDRLAHDRALLRWPGVRREGRARPHAGEDRLREGSAHGRRPERGRGPGPNSSRSARSRIRFLGANLDRIQIVKGWLDAKGELA